MVYTLVIKNTSATALGSTAMARLAIFEVAEPLIRNRTPQSGLALDVARGLGGAYLNNETEQALRALDRDGAVALFDRLERALGPGPSASRTWRWLEANLSV